MQAIVVEQFGEPEVLRLQEVPEPVPEAGEVLVRLQAIGVNPVECYIRSGIYGPSYTVPYTPGFDGAGIVVAVGKGVTAFAVGDRVYVARSLTGTYAELVLCIVAQVHALPEGVSFEQGAAIGIPYGAAYRALFHKAKGQPGETVLVHGASGAVGLASVQLAVAAGMRVLATAGSEEGRQLVLAAGAEAVVDHHDADHLDTILELTGGQGPDVILEMLANVNLAKDLEIIATGGRIAVIGNRGTIEINPREAMRKEAVIVGMTLFNATERESRSMYAAVSAGLANGTLVPTISQRLPLAEAARAHELVMHAHTLGKVVLVPPGV